MNTSKLQVKIILSVWLMGMALTVSLAQVVVKDLVTEYKTNPVGIAVQQPRLSWKLQSDGQGVMQTAYQIRVAETEAGLKDDEGLLWNSGKVESDRSIHVPYEGPRLTSGQKVYWQVRIWSNQDNKPSGWSAVATWEMGLLDISDWKAQWITPGWKEDLGKSEPAPYLRREFTLDKPVRSARIYATSLGLYELHLNGEKVGDEVFTPGWTAYHERLQYQVYDVTDELNNGSNAIGAILGDGWYRGHLGWEKENRNTYGTQLGLLLQLEVTYQDGTTYTVTTDPSWQAARGPILASDIYNGETYDARLEQAGWSEPGFAAGGWTKVELLDHTKNTLVASVGAPVKKIQELKPVSLFTTPKGEKVLDMGQNMVGWVRLKVKGERGDTVTLKFAEVLDKEGNFYTANLRLAKCTDVYILKGEGEEVYEPHFTFHGFRYVQVEGFPGTLTTDNITGIVVHSEMESIGTFVSSDSLLNQLQSNIRWGQKGNFLDVPTDCPQRDERLGWTGDAQVFAPTACFNFNTAPFYTKWMKDLIVEQREDGSVPWVVPNTVENGGGTGWSDGFGATGWADAAVIIPWTVYQTYGDKRILEDQYASMKGWVDYMRKHAGDRYIFDYGFHFGDWLSFAEYASYNYNAPDYGYAGAHTDKDLIATAYFYYTTGLFQKIATVLGKEEDAREMAALRPRIREAFLKEFMTETGRLTSNTQTAYSLALVFGLIPDEYREIAAERLADDVRYFGHLTTGFLGTPVLNRALSDNGYTDLAYMLLFNKRYPSWLYPVTQGATTIWERWDGIRPDGTFQTVGMNSFNHYAYGAIGEWLYTTVAGLGINPQKPGYKNIIFNPHPGGGLTKAGATLQTMYGKAGSSWELADDRIRYTVEIPANTTGTVILEGVERESVAYKGKSLKENKWISNIREEDGQLMFDLGSGTYEFTYPGN